MLLALENAELAELIRAIEAAEAAEVANAAEAAEAAKISLKVSSRSPLFLSLPPFQPVNLRVFCSPSSFARFGLLGPRSPYLYFPRFASSVRAPRHTVSLSWSGNDGLANCGSPSDEPAKGHDRKVLFEGYYC